MSQAWSWFQVVQDQRDTGRDFVYVFRCPACGDECVINSREVQSVIAQGRDGRCPTCVAGNRVPNFWEVLEPEAEITVSVKNGPTWTIRTYTVERRDNYDLTQAVAFDPDGSRYVSLQHSARPFALQEVLSRISGIVQYQHMREVGR